MKFSNFTHSIRKIEFHIYIRNYPKIGIFIRKLTSGNPWVQRTLRWFSPFSPKFEFFDRKIWKTRLFVECWTWRISSDPSNRININWFCINQSQPKDTHATFWLMTHRLWLRVRMSDRMKIIYVYIQNDDQHKVVTKNKTGKKYPVKGSMYWWPLPIWTLDTKNQIWVFFKTMIILTA